MPSGVRFFYFLFGAGWFSGHICCTIEALHQTNETINPFYEDAQRRPKGRSGKECAAAHPRGIHSQGMAGVYSFLPLGLRVINNINQIIREEMNAIGGQELALTALQDKKPWEKTGRWDDKVVDVWFKTALKNGSELGLAATHEEPLTQIMTEYVSSYRDLPIYAYQFQTKFRTRLAQRAASCAAVNFS